MTRHDAAYVADLFGKTERWVKSNASRLPHSRAGKTYFWDDEDIAALREFFRVRPGQHTADVDPLSPIPARRAS